MAFELFDLPYSYEALAPAISAETLRCHHGKHHKGYIDKTNAAIAGTPLDGAEIEEVIAQSRESDKSLFNNAAQVWNHSFYWQSLSPRGSPPAGELARWVDTSFGSLDDLRKQLVERGNGHFASGWLWLVARRGRLSIVETHDADTLADTDAASETLPLLVIDLWEHAYYLDHQNRRAEYLEQVVERHLNWDFAAENFGRGTVWKRQQASLAH
jgi:Fe-Mn family superoxide dismutase